MLKNCLFLKKMTNPRDLKTLIKQNLKHLKSQFCQDFLEARK